MLRGSDQFVSTGYHPAGGAMSDTQMRAIIGEGKTERHYVLYREHNTDVWAVPGLDMTGVEYIGGDRLGVYKTRTATTDQLKQLAESKGLRFRIVEKYPLIRAPMGLK